MTTTATHGIRIERRATTSSFARRLSRTLPVTGVPVTTARNAAGRRHDFSALSRRSGRRIVFPYPSCVITRCLVVIRYSTTDGKTVASKFPSRTSVVVCFSRRRRGHFPSPVVRGGRGVHYFTRARVTWIFARDPECSAGRVVPAAVQPPGDTRSQKRPEESRTSGRYSVCRYRFRNRPRQLSTERTTCTRYSPAAIPCSRTRSVCSSRSRSPVSCPPSWSTTGRRPR